jgi:hypothetical protein
MKQNSVNLYDIPFELLFNRVKSHFSQYLYDHKKHAVMLADNPGEIQGYIRLPLHLSIDDQLIIKNAETVVLYLSIESGSAVISIKEGKVTVFHTTFSAYMTRKKQGVSQIKYLNKKGKSRAGSRVRLAATIDFFENINNTLTQLFNEYKLERIALSCSTTLIPYLFNSKVACPFDKRDARLYKIPIHIPRSNFINMDKTIKKLMAPVLFYDPQYEDMVKTSMLC